MQKLLNKLHKQSELDRVHIETSRADSNAELKVSIKPYMM